MSGDSGQNEKERRDLLVDQLAYLIEEVEGVRMIAEALPEEVLSARPFEGEPSVLDLFQMLAHLDSGVRLENVVRFTTDAEGSELSATSEVHERVPSPDLDATLATSLERIVDARRRLVQVLTNLDDAAWQGRTRVDDMEVSLQDYLFRILQEDLEILQAVAYRVYESRPVGSPGFAAR